MLQSLRHRIRAGEAIRPLPPGVHHFQSPPDAPRQTRIHLRIEPDGSAFLLLNASVVLHLNQTASEYAYLLIRQADADEAAAHITQRYRSIRRDQAARDYLEFKDQIQALIEAQDQDPVLLIGCEREALYAGDLSAPYRLDCALTYSLAGTVSAGSTPTQRVTRELGTDEWRAILDKAWAHGIPHIIFTGGEPTLRDDLPELIAHAELNGQVTGLLTTGHRLDDPAYLKLLLAAGLDHTLITLDWQEPSAWGALSSFTYWRDLLKEDIFVAVHITLSKHVQDGYARLLDQLQDAGITAVSLTAESEDLAEDFEQAREEAGRRGLELIWGLPVPYSHLNPVQFEIQNATDEGRISGAGKGWLYVEPDGDVLPSQGIVRSLGNMLTSPWGEIWSNAQDYRAQTQAAASFK